MRTRGGEGGRAGCHAIRKSVYDIFAIKTKFQIHQSPYIINKNNTTSSGRVSRVVCEYLRGALTLTIGTCAMAENVVYYTKKFVWG